MAAIVVVVIIIVTLVLILLKMYNRYRRPRTRQFSTPTHRPPTHSLSELRFKPKPCGFKENIPTIACDNDRGRG